MPTNPWQGNRKAFIDTARLRLKNLVPGNVLRPSGQIYLIGAVLPGLDGEPHYAVRVKWTISGGRGNDPTATPEWVLVVNESATRNCQELLENRDTIQHALGQPILDELNPARSSGRASSDGKGRKWNVAVSGTPFDVTNRDACALALDWLARRLPVFVETTLPHLT